MKIRPASNQDEDRWDAFVGGQPDAYPYHRFAWKLAVEETYRQVGRYLLAERDGRIVGVLPLFHFRVPLASGRLLSLPYCDVGGPLGEDADVRRRLVGAAIDLAGTLGVAGLVLRGTAPPEEVPGHAWTPLAGEKIRMVLDLPRDPDELMASFRAKLRSQIRKAEKNGLEFGWAGPDGVADFYRIFCRNMKELGSPVHARKLFSSLLRHFGDGARLGLVRLGDTPVAGGVLLSAGDRLCVPWASSLREHNRLAPNMLLYWGFLAHGCATGFARFDFGRSTVDEGTYRFKAQWGARPAPLAWREIELRGPRRRGTATGSSRDFMARLWRSMPLPLANAVGPRLRQYISL